jgi:hypothetical protein
MTVATRILRRISPLIRSVRYVRNDGDRVILLGRHAVERQPDGTLMVHDARFGPHRHRIGKPTPIGPVVETKWLVTQMMILAEEAVSNHVTEEERLELHEEEDREIATNPDHFEHRQGVDKLNAMVCRLLMGYGRTAERAAGLCTFGISSLIDPDLRRAIRAAGGWGAVGMQRFIRSWDVQDAQGRQIGLSSRPIQVSCMAWAMCNHMARGVDGGVGIRGVIEVAPTKRTETYDRFSWDAETVPEMSFIEMANLEYRESLPTIHEICDALPSALRQAGVKPAFWRMALRMKPSQIAAFGKILEGRWSRELTDLLNLLSTIGEDLLPPSLIKKVGEVNTQHGMGGLSWTAVTGMLHRAAVGISMRRSRQSLRDALAEMSDVADYVTSEAIDAIPQVGMRAIPPQPIEEERIDPDTCDENFPGSFDFQYDPTEWAEYQRQTKEESKLHEERDMKVKAHVLSMLPSSRKWRNLLAASKAWHAEMQQRMDEGDDRSWEPLGEIRTEIDGVVATELVSAADLRAETRDNDHCVGNGEYAARCMKGTTRIYTLRVPGRRVRSTLQVQLIGTTWEAVQHRGPSNSVPKAELAAAAKQLLRGINAQERRRRTANDDQAAAIAA